jgi:hypothetical protein
LSQENEMMRFGSRLAMLALVAGSIAGSARAVEVPVYPGARVDGAERACCTFTTTDPLSKVRAFYAAKFGPPLSDGVFRERYPEVARAFGLAPRSGDAAGPTLANIEKALWVLDERNFGGKRVPAQMLIVMATPTGTGFSIPEADMPPGSDALKAYRRAKGVQNPEERELAQWSAAHPRVDPARYRVPAYPNANVMFEDYAGPACFTVTLATADPLDQVIAFYERSATGFQRVEQAEPTAEWLDWNFGAHRPKAPRGAKVAPRAYFDVWYGRPGAVNRHIVVDDAASGRSAGTQLELLRDGATGGGQERVPAKVRIELTAEIIGGGCVRERPAANTRDGRPPEPPHFMSYRDHGVRLDQEGGDEH